MALLGVGMIRVFLGNPLRWSILWEGTVPVGSNSTTSATVAVAVAADTAISGFGRIWFYHFQQAKRERALGALNGTLLHGPYIIFLGIIGLGQKFFFSFILKTG